MKIFAFLALTVAVVSSVQATTVADWGNCHHDKRCTSATSTCKKFSAYYSQCLPAVLPSGGLCGQHDGTNDWDFDGHCLAGETCIPVGTNRHCRPNGATSAPVIRRGGDAAIWGDCTHGETCVNSQCVQHSQYYAQCTPNPLPKGHLCGQSKIGIYWKFPNCTYGKQCLPYGNTGDFRCQ